MPKIEELRSKIAALSTELLALGERDGDLEGDDAQRWTDGNVEFEQARADLAAEETRLARVGEIRSAAETNPVETGDDRTEKPKPSVTLVKRAYDDPFDIHQVRSRPESDEWNDEMRGRLNTALESKADFMRHMTDGQREAVHQVTSHDSKHAADIARYCLITGSKAYHDGFRSYVESFGQFVDPKVQDEYRTAMSLTGANGGYLVPFTLDPTIILTNTGATDPFRQISKVVQITTNAWHGVSSAGVNAQWLAEATEAADASPTFAQPTIPVYKAAAWVFGSYEFLEDSGFSSEVGMLLADARDRLEATAHAVGSGSGQPTGVITAVSTSSGSRVAGASGNLGLSAPDIFSVASSLPPRYRPNAKWVAEFTTLNTIRQLSPSAAGSFFWADLNVGTPPLLLGKPVYESSAMDSTIVSGSTDSVLIIGDFQNYVIVDRIGMSIQYDPLVLGSNRIPTGQAGWFAFWRTGADVVNYDAFRLLVL